MVKQSTSTTDGLSGMLQNTITLNQALRKVLDDVFTKEYAKHLENRKPNYEIRHKHGKYKVIKYYGQDYEGAQVIAEGLTKEVAEGYIKLLKEK